MTYSTNSTLFTRLAPDADAGQKSCPESLSWNMMILILTNLSRKGPIIHQKYRRRSDNQKDASVLYSPRLRHISNNVLDFLLGHFLTFQPAFIVTNNLTVLSTATCADFSNTKKLRSKGLTKVMGFRIPWLLDCKNYTW